MPSLHCSKTTLWYCKHWRCFKHGVSIHLKDYEYFGLLCLLTVQGVPRLITAEVKHNQSLVGRHRPGVLVGWNAQGSPSGFSEPQQTQSQVFRPWLLRPSNKGFILLLTSPFSLLCQRPLNVEANMTGHFVWWHLFRVRSRSNNEGGRYGPWPHRAEIPVGSGEKAGKWEWSRKWQALW